jgi:hypothetical protein
MSGPRIELVTPEYGSEESGQPLVPNLSVLSAFTTASMNFHYFA